jgi:hypothetical protein
VIEVVDIGSRQAGAFSIHAGTVLDPNDAIFGTRHFVFMSRPIPLLNRVLQPTNKDAQLYTTRKPLNALGFDDNRAQTTVMVMLMVK